MVTYCTIFSVPAMSSLCSSLVTAITMKHCSAVLVNHSAQDRKWDGFSSQLSGSEITASERRAEGEGKEKETMKK